MHAARPQAGNRGICTDYGHSFYGHLRLEARRKGMVIIVNPGQEIVKWLKPAGCALVLLITALAMIMLFTSGKDPVAGYEAPQTSDYYAAHPEELKAELEEHLFPLLEGIGDCEITDEGKLRVTLEGEDYAVARSAILQYYDDALFEFVVPSG